MSRDPPTLRSESIDQWRAFVCRPARRASRKLLERVVEFLKVLDCEDKIIEFNQEACRIHSYDGKKSLIRSFPVSYN